MQLSRIDLNLLVVFETIYAEGSITKAAARLHVTRSAVSHALSRLRTNLGDPLFERRGSAIVPTPLARRLIDPLRDSLTRIGVLLNEGPAFTPAVAEQRYVIGLSDTLEGALMPPMIRALSLEAPHVSVSAVHVDRLKMESELAAGTIDLALDMLSLRASGRVMRAPVLEEAMVVVARAGHPATRDRQLDLDGYLAQGHILVSARRSGLAFEDTELRRLGRQRRVVARCRHHFAACRIASQTDHLLTMPESYASIVNQQFGNQLLPFPAPIPPYSVSMYWHVSMDSDPANQWLRASALRALQN
ncbi:MAG TPA: LysR family transcriptional regulator [Sphingobium sp.]